MVAEALGAVVADVERAAQGIFASAFLNAGQTCAALKRLYVHESVYEALTEKRLSVLPD